MNLVDEVISSVLEGLHQSEASTSIVAAQSGHGESLPVQLPQLQDQSVDNSIGQDVLGQSQFAQYLPEAAPSGQNWFGYSSGVQGSSGQTQYPQNFIGQGPFVQNWSTEGSFGQYWGGQPQPLFNQNWSGPPSYAQNWHGPSSSSQFWYGQGPQSSPRMMQAPFMQGLSGSYGNSSASQWQWPNSQGFNENPSEKRF